MAFSCLQCCFNDLDVNLRNRFKKVYKPTPSPSICDINDRRKKLQYTLNKMESRKYNFVIVFLPQ